MPEFQSARSPGGIGCERVRHASKLGARSFTVSSLSTHGSRRVNTPKREPIEADDDHACVRSSPHVFRSRCNGTTSARFRDRAAATIEAKRFVA